MTELRYMHDMQLLELDARVTRITPVGDRRSVSLDQTIFYPQGGGQPFDQGSITGPEGKMDVQEVRWGELGPEHIGAVTGTLEAGQQVRLMVDRDRRELHTRIHSAGHLVDMAVDRLGLGWVPGKGYHFPEGPYVEYRGSLETPKEELIERLETTIASLLEENFSTELRFVPSDQLGQYCRVVPEGIPTDEPVRIVLYGRFGVACGGTHVEQLGDIGRVVIRKIKAKGDAVRVSYAVDQNRTTTEVRDSQDVRDPSLRQTV